jgi:hypothetical protein
MLDDGLISEVNMSRTLPTFTPRIAITNGRQGLELFTLSPEGVAWHRTQTNAGKDVWGQWISLKKSSLIALTTGYRVKDERLELFAIDDAFGAWHCSNANNWQWERMPANDQIVTQIVVGPNPDKDKFMLFGISGRSSRVYTSYLGDGGDWQPWSETRNGLLNVYNLTAASDSIYQPSFVPILRDQSYVCVTHLNGGRWDVQSIPENYTSNQASMIQRFDGSLALFTVTRSSVNYTFQDKSKSGAWQPWSTLIDHGVSQVRSARNADGRLEVFVLIDDASLHHIWEQTPGGPWSGASGLGKPPGRLIADISVVRNAQGQLVVCALDDVGGVWRIQQQVGWTGWIEMSGPTSDPAWQPPMFFCLQMGSGMTVEPDSDTRWLSLHTPVYEDSLSTIFSAEAIYSADKWVFKLRVAQTPLYVVRSPIDQTRLILSEADSTHLPLIFRGASKRDGSVVFSLVSDPKAFLAQMDDRTLTLTSNPASTPVQLAMVDFSALQRVAEAGNCRGIIRKAGAVSDKPSVEWKVSTHQMLVDKVILWLFDRSLPVPSSLFDEEAVFRLTFRQEINTLRQNVLKGLEEADNIAHPTYTCGFWFCHFYDPDVGVGLGVGLTQKIAPSALERCLHFAKVARDARVESPQDIAKIGFNLGLSLHYLTDLTQPMHAANCGNVISDDKWFWPGDLTHGALETAVETRVNDYLVPPLTVLDDMGTLEELVHHTAVFSKRIYDRMVGPWRSEMRNQWTNDWKPERVEIILQNTVPNALRATAAFILMWMRDSSLKNPARFIIQSAGDRSLALSVDHKPVQVLRLRRRTDQPEQQWIFREAVWPENSLVICSAYPRFLPLGCVEATGGPMANAAPIRLGTRSRESGQRFYRIRKPNDSNPGEYLAVARSGLGLNMVMEADARAGLRDGAIIQQAPFTSNANSNQRWLLVPV